MSDYQDWLPPIIKLEDFAGNWQEYESALYYSFQQDFVRNLPNFKGIRLALKRHPLYDNKEATYWHMISNGSNETEREPDLRRCERICWPRAIIENHNDKAVKVWENTRKGQTRICLWLEQEEYLVILSKRNGYILPWTAYLVTQSHRKRKLQKEYEEYQRLNP